jgi:antibiotic biosynthesis monooxygenase (ABM) superfamily enzyme
VLRIKALGVDDTNSIHMDFDHGRRIMAWVRSNPDKQDLIVAVAKFFAEKYTRQQMCRAQLAKHA